MRILVVSNGFPPRGRFGTEFYTRELVRGLAARGHELAVLHPVRDGSRPRYSLEEVREEGVPVFLLHNPGDPRKRFRTSYEDARVEAVFDELLARWQPECVHFLYLVWGLSVRLPEVARRRGIPAAVTLTDFTLLCHRGQMYDHRLERCFGPHPPAVCARCIREPGPYDLPPFARAVKRTLAHGLAAFGGLGLVPTAADLARRESFVRGVFDAAATLIAPTANLLELFRRGGAPAEKLVHLPYAFDEAPFVAVRDRAPHPPGSSAPARFGFFGQFAPHKGFGTLLEAAQRLERERPGAFFEVVLYGSPAPGRHRLFAERLLGRTGATCIRRAAPFEPDEAARVLAGLTALVAPSEWDENAPLAILQARSAGVPVVASDVPGIAEVVVPGRHGLLFPPGDASALAAALAQVLDGEPGRALDPGLPLSYDEHLSRLEELHRTLSTPAHPQAK